MRIRSVIRDASFVASIALTGCMDHVGPGERAQFSLAVPSRSGFSMSEQAARSGLERVARALAIGLNRPEL